MVNSELDDVFGSLSDVTRRDILRRLSHGELSVSDIADTYNMSLPAISKHIRVLERSQLICKEKRGRQYFVRLAPAAFEEANEHLQYYETVLHNRLDTFSTYVHKPARRHIVKATKSHKASDTKKIVIRTVVDKSLEDTWQAYTDPESICQWWGPKGAALISCENDVRQGGIWRFVLRGKDNNEYVFSGIYSAVSQPNLLQYSDGIGEPGKARPESQVSVSFEALPDGKTLVIKTISAMPAIHQLLAAWLKAAHEAA
jgi:uncharacterized protein YndB with AHSA1/START domain/DNA-binding transcriptional ArsR family regulator